MTLQFITHGYIRLDQNMNILILTHASKKLTPDSSIGLIFLSRRKDFEAVMLLHSDVITRIQIVSKVLSRDLLNTKLKFLVPLSIGSGFVLDPEDQWYRKLLQVKSLLSIS